MHNRAMVRVAFFLLVGVLASGQGREAKPKASDYPGHVQGAKLAVAAEYLAQTAFAGPGRSIDVPQHLVIEIAVYPVKGHTINISAGDFTLYLNGKKTALLAQTSGIVAAALKYSDWTRRPTATASVGMGDADVVLGPDRPSSRFPGDNREARTRLPAPRPRERPDEPYKKDQQPREEIVVQSALPEGAVSMPVAGYLYFPYSGKLKSIRSVDLLYQPIGENIKLRLM